MEKAWNLRSANFPPTLSMSTPSAKTFDSDFYRNQKNRFVNVSVTGSGCALDCEHCKGGLLESMVPVGSGAELEELGKELVQKGCEGVLVSGGATKDGEVPLDGFFDAISELKGMGLKVLVHTGLATKETAGKLKHAGADQALLDIIGDEETIRKVYHLDKRPEDFLTSMRVLKDAGLDVAPHIVIGLNFGKISGEYRALEMVTSVEPANIVLVVLDPKVGTPMEDVRTPEADEVGKLVATARILNPEAHISLGCARPPGPSKIAMEKYAVKGGVTGIAYPMDETIKYAIGLGLKPEFKDTCCSLPE